MALTDNIVSYWKMDGNSTDAAGSNNGTDTSMSYSVGDGKINQGAHFDGSAGFIQKSSPVGTPTGNSDMTINLWVNMAVNQPAGINGVVTMGAESNNSLAGFGIGPQGVNGLYWLGFNNDVQASWSYSTSTWYMVTATYTASSQQVQFYVNASTQGGALTLTNTPTIGSTFLDIGKQRPGNAVLFQGSMDEIGIWSRVLLGSEISQLYNGGAGLQYPFSSSRASFLNLLGVS